MKIKDETAAILRILKECAKLGVSHLKMGEVEISFSPESVAQERPMRTKEKPRLQAQFEKEFIEKQELKLKQEQMDELILTDPEEYERRLAEGELFDAEELHDSGTEPVIQ